MIELVTTNIEVYMTVYTLHQVWFKRNITFFYVCNSKQTALELINHLGLTQKLNNLFSDVPKNNWVDVMKNIGFQITEKEVLEEVF